MAEQPIAIVGAGGEQTPLAALFRELRRSTTAVALLLFVTTALGVLVGFVIPHKYRATVTLAPANPSSGAGDLSGITGQFGGLAALAGIDLPGQSDKAESIEYLRSRDLAGKVIDELQLLPVLYASGWDARQQKWRSTNPRKVPTRADGIRRFTRSVRSISEDRRSGIVTLSVTWRDREQAALWANTLVRRANQELRGRAVVEAQRSLAYLYEQAEKTDQTALHEAIYRLVEAQLKTIMYANSREEYAFKVIDPALVPEPEDHVSPKWPITGGLGLVMGLALAFCWLLLRASRRTGAADALGP